MESPHEQADARGSGKHEKGGGAVYSIGAVSRMTGLPVATIRDWEERYGIVEAVRGPGGQRRYTRRHLEHLMFLAAQVESGLAPGDAHSVLAGRIEAGGARADEYLAGPVAAGDAVRILIADRDRYAADIADYFLRTEGYVVAVCEDGDDARRQVELLPPRLAIIELMLSGAVDKPLFEQVKRADALLVATSPLAASHLSDSLGADAFLQKPIDPLILVSTVRDLLGTSALTEPLRPGS